MATRKKITPKARKTVPLHIKPDQRDPAHNPAMHRRILTFINEAVSIDDLMFERRNAVHVEGGFGHQGNPQHEDNPDNMKMKRKMLMSRETARRILDLREKQYPLGFRNINELFAKKQFIIKDFIHLFDLFSDTLYGRWETFPLPIPRRGPGGNDGVVHAALCHTGKVLFITAAETTMLWDPNNTAASTFEDPANQPDYSQLCGHHVFLPDGRLLSVGGGGYGPNPVAQWGWKFDPVAKSWSRTSNSMSESKWYPTANILNDDKVLITCGNTSGNMDIYDVASDTFSPMTGDTRHFPNLYPGLHVLPNSVMVYTRTGWGNAGPGGSATADNQSAFFTITGATSGVWNNIAAASVNRCKGMSVLLYSSIPPYVRLMVMGGVDNATNNSYEILDATVLSSLSAWGPSTPFPDGEHRSLCSVVLLPDGNAFMCGGIQRVNSPCALYNPITDSWSAMAALPSIRDYHSVSILLPSGQVMMAGWNNTSIELYNPPYLFAGGRPTITTIPALVHHGQTFMIESPDAASIAKVVLVRPMAITHQTDGEQRVLEMPLTHDPAHPTQLTLLAPHGGHPHAVAPKGYYMLFAVNIHGVPSEGKFIFLH
ncbi:MAG: galactose oxidase-like domain-containing protein [Verrucomicrobiota bacterium]